MKKTVQKSTMKIEGLSQFYSYSSRLIVILMVVAASSFAT